MAKKTSLKVKQKATKPKARSSSAGKTSTVDRALADFEKHDKLVDHHRNKRDLAEAKIRVAGHAIQHVYPGEKTPSVAHGRPKIKTVKVQ